MSLSRRFFIIILTLSVFLVVYLARQNELLRDFTYSSDTVKNQLSQHVQLSCSFVDQMSLIGEEYFLNGTRNPSPWRSMLREDAARDSFNMDALGQSGLTDSAGNLTGVGRLEASAGKKENIELSLLYNPHFKSFFKTLPGIAWVYYTGAEGFINIYPWVSSEDYHFSLEEFNRPFYLLGTPSKNPNRMRYWTPVYMDTAGKGLMVTVSKPVYDGDTFRGVVSLDFTLETLTTLMDPQYNSFVINAENQVLAGTAQSDRLSEKVFTLEDYLGAERAKDLALITYSRSNVLSTAGGYYVYTTGIENSPWTLVNLMPQWQVVSNALLFSGPVLLIGILLLLSNNAYERQQKTEQILKSTVEDLEDSRYRLEAAASVDFLTGALNRRSMTARMNEEVSLYARHGTPFSLVMGDLDHFKHFNDQYGHAAGDMILEEVVRAIKSHIRGADMLSRWGGEEFLLLFPNTPSAEAKAAAENLRKAIEALSFSWEDNVDLKITMTFGVAEFNPVQGLDHSIIQADDALYHAKITGRNRVVAFEEMV